MDVSDTHTLVEWGISSTNGNARLSCVLDHDDGISLVHEVRIDYRLPGDEQATASASVRRLALSKDRLGELLVDLRSWLGQPLDAIGARGFEHRADLAEEAAQSLTLEFGPRQDLIIGVGGVGCLIQIRSSALRADLGFRTDATCLELLAEGLEDVLAVAC
jgi:hypothetical protein